jgi:hypothetical protein
VGVNWWNPVGNVVSVSSPVRYGCRQASSVCRCGLNMAAAGRGIGFAMLDAEPIPAYPNSGGAVP